MHRAIVTTARSSKWVHEWLELLQLCVSLNGVVHLDDVLFVCSRVDISVADELVRLLVVLGCKLDVFVLVLRARAVCGLRSALVSRELR